MEQQESSHEILRHCSHEEFKGQVLPAAQKAMLRNPEIILSSEYATACLPQITSPTVVFLLKNGSLSVIGCFCGHGSHSVLGSC